MLVVQQNMSPMGKIPIRDESFAQAAILSFVNSLRISGKNYHLENKGQILNKF